MALPVSNKLRNFAHLSLITLFTLTVFPFVQPYHTDPYPGFYSEWAAFSIGITASLIFLVREFWPFLIIPRTTLYWLALVAVVLLQGVLFPYKYITQPLMPALYISWAILLMVVTVSLRGILGRENIVIVLAWCILIGAIIQSLLASFQHIHLYGNLSSIIATKQGATVFGNLGQQNHFATQIMLGCVALIYLFSLRRLSWIFSVAIATLFTMVMALSSSRAVILYGTGVVLLAFFSYRKTHSDIHSRILIMSILVFTFFVLSQFFLPHLAAWLKQALAALGFDTNQLTLLTTLEKIKSGSSGLDVRISEWHKAWLMFLQTPLLGTGVGLYAWHSYLHQATPEFSGIFKPDLFNHSHNLFTQILAEMGLIGIVLLTLMLSTWVRQFKNQWLTPSGYFIASCMLVLFIHSNVEYPLWYSYFLGVAAILLALGDEHHIRVHFSPKLGQIGTSIAIPILGIILVTTLTGYRQLEAATSQQYIKTPIPTIHKVMQVANNPILEPYAESTLYKFLALDKSAITTKLAISARLIYWRPLPKYIYPRAILLALNDQIDAAKKLLHQAAVAYPDNLPLYINLMRTIPGQEIQPLLAEAEKIARERNIPLTPSPAPLAGAP